MLRRRVSIAGLMWAVFISGVGLAASKSGSDEWSGVIFLLTCGTLALGVVGIACDVPEARRWWVGFTLFGLGYLFLAFGRWLEPLNLPPLATDEIIEWLGRVIKTDSKVFGHEPLSGYDLSVFWAFARIAHCLFALAIGTAGGFLAWWSFPAPSHETPSPVGPPTDQSPAARRRWTWAVGPGLVILYAAALGMGIRTAPSLCAGTTVLLTWAVLGLLALGAVFSRGRRRARCLGAVLFGVGYLAPIAWHRGEETWSEIPGNRFVRAVRPYLPAVPTERRATSEGTAAANARILKALDRPISFHFPGETPLEEALRHVATSAPTDDGRPLPIYVNTTALQEVDKTLQSPVTLVLENVPARSGLRCLVEQHGLTYAIRGGLIEVLIENHRTYSDPAYEDPLLLTGHCLLALVAAGLGGLFAPLVCERGIQS